MIERSSGLKIVNIVIASAVIILLAGSLAYFFLDTNSITSYSTTPQVSQYTTEYPTSSPETAPNAIAVDAGGNVWFTLENQSVLAELNPSTGKIQEFKIPTKLGTTTWGIVVDNSRGLVWFTEQATNSIWSFNMATHKFTRYELQAPNSFPFGIALDSQGDVWFTEFFVNDIGEISTNGTLHEISIPQSGDLEASGITVSSSGTVWFTLPGADEIGSYFDGKFAFQNLTGLVSLPVGIAVTSNGNIFFTQHGPSFISEFNPTTGYLETISTTVPVYYYSSLPYFIYSDQYGSVWFDEHEGNSEAEFFPSNNTLVEYFIPTRVITNISGMLTSTVSPDGKPWYTEFFAGKVGTINTQVPLDLHLNLLNYTQPVILQSNGTVSLEISVGGSAASQATIKEEVGNFSSSFAYNYSQSSAGQIVAIHDEGSAPGVYFVTISAMTSSLAVSQIVELDVR